MEQTTWPIIIGYLTRELLAWAKRSEHLGWINEATPGIARGLSFLLTFVGTFGVVMTCSGSMATGFDCRLTIPPQEQLQAFFVQWIQAQVSAYVLHHIAKK